MNGPPEYLFDLRLFVILFFASVVAVLGAVLTYLAMGNVPQALIAGGVAGGWAYAWGKSNVKPSWSNHRSSGAEDAAARGDEG